MSVNYKGNLFKRGKYMYRALHNIKNLKFLALFLILLSTLFIIYGTNYSVQREIEFINSGDERNLSEILEEESLQILDEKTLEPSNRSIFFIETSAKGRLDSRQLCAVESAARAHPNWEVHVLFTAPIDRKFSRDFHKTFNESQNVQFTQISVDKFAEGTPVHQLVTDGRLTNSRYRISHTSDVLRFLTLHKWGGVYLDLDVIVARSLDDLSNNWAARESDTSLGSSALAFSCDEIGRKIADACIKELVTTFNGSRWGYNGPALVTRVLKKTCTTRNVTKMNAEKCAGFEVYDPKYFYPIAWQHGKDYFDKSIPDSQEFKDTYGYHVWNRRTSESKILPNSLYNRITKIYCPKTYAQLIL